MNGRISATFCWLPPERYCVGCSIDAAFSLQPAHEVVDRLAFALRRLTNPNRP